MLARTPVHGRGARAGSLNPHPLFFFLPSPFLADGVHGGQGRCFLFWQEFLTCMKGDDRVGSITTRSRRARTHTRTRTLEEESRALLSHPAPWLSREQKPKTENQRTGEKKNDNAVNSFSASLCRHPVHPPACASSLAVHRLRRAARGLRRVPALQEDGTPRTAPVLSARGRPKQRIKPLWFCWPRSGRASLLFCFCLPHRSFVCLSAAP